MTRNYRQEYARYQGTPEQKKKDVHNETVQDMAIREGLVTKGSGFDVHHRDGNPMNNSRSNLVVAHKSQNRSFKRDKNGRKA